MPYFCPRCFQELEHLDYRSIVHEYGYFDLSDECHNSDDCETQATDYNCPECDFGLDMEDVLSGPSLAESLAVLPENIAAGMRQDHDNWAATETGQAYLRRHAADNHPEPTLEAALERLRATPEEAAIAIRASEPSLIAPPYHPRPNPQYLGQSQAMWRLCPTCHKASEVSNPDEEVTCACGQVLAPELKEKDNQLQDNCLFVFN
jgi:hypothetical protein